MNFARLAQFSEDDVVKAPPKRQAPCKSMPPVTEVACSVAKDRFFGGAASDVRSPSLPESRQAALAALGDHNMLGFCAICLFVQAAKLSKTRAPIPHSEVSDADEASDVDTNSLDEPADACGADEQNSHPSDAASPSSSSSEDSSKLAESQE